MLFQPSNLTLIFSQGVLFCPRGYFFENLPLFKGKQKGKWKKPKNREKKVQSPEKNLPLILFWPHFLTQRPIFLTFWDFALQSNPITPNPLFLSNAFPFLTLITYPFSNKIQSVFSIHPNFQSQGKTNFKESTQFPFSHPSDFQTFWLQLFFLIPLSNPFLFFQLLKADKKTPVNFCEVPLENTKQIPSYPKIQGYT